MNNALKCIIVDDEPLAREGMEEYVQQVDFLNLVGTCKNAIEASAVIHRESVDLVFLDIQMPLLTGIEFLRELANPPTVIFTTAHREFALEGFELQAADYLLKPISFARFLRAVNKVHESRKTNQPTAEPEDHFYVKEDGRLVKVLFRDILFVEGVKDYIFIHTKEQRHMVLTSMKSAMERLSSHSFMRVHRSYIINTAYVEALEGNTLHMGKHKVPVSKNHREEVISKVVGNKLWRRE